MSPDVLTDVGALFVCGCPLARQQACSNLWLNCKLTIHSADLPSASFSFNLLFLKPLPAQSASIHYPYCINANSLFLGAAKPRPIHCQSNEPRCPEFCEQGVFRELLYPLRKAL